MERARVTCSVLDETVKKVSLLVFGGRSVGGGRSVAVGSVAGRERD